MKVTLKEGIQNYIEDNYYHYKNDILLADGFEEAFIGVSRTKGSVPRATYDEARCIEILIKRDGMTLKEAVEYFDFVWRLTLVILLLLLFFPLMRNMTA